MHCRYVVDMSGFLARTSPSHLNFLERTGISFKDIAYEAFSLIGASRHYLNPEQVARLVNYDVAEKAFEDMLMIQHMNVDNFEEHMDYQNIANKYMESVITLYWAIYHAVAGPILQLFPHEHTPDERVTITDFDFQVRGTAAYVDVKAEY